MLEFFPLAPCSSLSIRAQGELFHLVRRSSIRGEKAECFFQGWTDGMATGWLEGDDGVSSYVTCFVDIASSAVVQQGRIRASRIKMLSCCSICKLFVNSVVKGGLLSLNLKNCFFPFIKLLNYRLR